MYIFREMDTKITLDWTIAKFQTVIAKQFYSQMPAHNYQSYTLEQWVQITMHHRDLLQNNLPQQEIVSIMSGIV